jgi:hypothetical protein
MSARRRTGEFRALADRWMKRVDPHGRRRDAAAAMAWAGVVGDEIARHTLGMAVRDGELAVCVDSPTWANELSLMAEELRVRLNATLGKDPVRSIRFTVSKKVREETRWSEGRLREQEMHEPDDVPVVPLTDDERLQVEYVAAAIHDQALREAAIRAMTSSLEWKKGIKARDGSQLPSE